VRRRPRKRAPVAACPPRQGKPRRRPLAPQLADELRQLRDERQPTPTDPVVCGLESKRLQPTILAAIIGRAAERAGLEKCVTAHTLRHTAATPSSRPSPSAAEAPLRHRRLALVLAFADDQRPLLRREVYRSS
jgi:integrase